MDIIKHKAKELSQKFINFNTNLVSPYHVVNKVKLELESAGFVGLKESDKWELKKGNKYYIIRGHSSIISFTIPKNFSTANTAFKIIGSHVDSPCLRLAPKSKLVKNDIKQAYVQLYGGGLWDTWLDRDLTIGGRVVVSDPNEGLKTMLYFSEKPIAILPNLCIHLRNDGNDMKYNYENNFRPILASTVFDTFDENSKNSGISNQLLNSLIKDICDKLKIQEADIIDYDLCFADANEPKFTGINEEFINSARLDNVFSVFSATESLIQASKDFSDEDDICVSMGFDHEEIGSQTYVGADSAFLSDIMSRIIENIIDNNEKIDLNEIYKRIISRSFILSCDMAHSVHPNFEEYHHNNHKPTVNNGIVLKINANQRYTSDAMSQAIFKTIAKRCEVPVQPFIVKNNSRCGSTIGPMIASGNSLLSVDIGAPQYAMHSIRETCGTLDTYYYVTLMKEFYNNKLPKFD